MKLSPDEPARVLASGIDSLVLAVDVVWKSNAFIGEIDRLKTQASLNEEPEPGQLATPGEDGWVWYFAVRTHGADGYAWLLTSKEFAMKIGDWKEPINRPSIMIEIRSETLWSLGAEAAVQRILTLLEAAEAEVKIVKASRADLCCDLLVPEAEFTPDLNLHRVTRAQLVDAHECRGRFSGLSIGRGAFSARLYDKPLEIVTKSAKTWMFDIWGFDSAPEGHRVVRVEFQTRREAIKTLGINTWEDLLKNAPSLWRYASERWLRFVEDPKLHHTQQTVLPWWQVVVQGYAGAQDASACVRAKSIKHDKRRLAAMYYGALISMTALTLLETGTQDDEVLDLQSFMEAAADLAMLNYEMDDEEFTRKVKRRIHKFARSMPRDNGAFGGKEVS